MMYSAVVNFVASKEQSRRKPVDFQDSATMSRGEIRPARRVGQILPQLQID